MYNATPGTLNLSDGYNCKKCLNRGNTARAVLRGGMWYETYDECECMKVRIAIGHMQASGLEATIKTKNLNTFRAESDWQKVMLDTAWRYVNEGAAKGAWFYVGGQSGSGKTHLCTGIARELLYAGRAVKYVIWEQISKHLKAMVNDPEYGSELRKLENAEVLYIDDLFKPIRGNDPTDADMKLAFELLNARTVNNLPTIISSERYLDDIFILDEAIEGRINEKSKGFAIMIERDASRNQRRRCSDKV